MSIIYDALKKTQKRFIPKADAPSSSGGKDLNLWLFIGFLTVGFIACAILLVLLFYNPAPNVPFTYSDSIKNVPSLPVEVVKEEAIATEVTGSPLLPSVVKEVEEKEEIKYQKPILSGIFEMSGENSALISGVIVKVGDYVDGLEVLEISSNEVTLSFNGEPVILKLK